MQVTWRTRVSPALPGPGLPWSLTCGSCVRANQPHKIADVFGPNYYLFQFSSQNEMFCLSSQTAYFHMDIYFGNMLLEMYFKKSTQPEDLSC